MLAELIDRGAMKQASRRILQDAQVPPRRFLALYLGLALAIDLANAVSGTGILGIFVMVLAYLLGVVLLAGVDLYFMAIRRGERSEYLTLFDGFSMAGKIIALYLLMTLFVFLWSMLFVIPGLVALYRYRFALYNLCEDPDMSPLEAINMSKRQTLGYKSQLFGLDLSYLGWTLLANLPLYFYNSLVSYSAVGETWGAYLEMTPPPVDAAALPVWGWTLVIGLWALAVSLGYRHVFITTELGYFETAKRTSGVGWRPLQAPLREEDRDPGGPDPV